MITVFSSSSLELLTDTEGLFASDIVFCILNIVSKISFVKGRELEKL